MFKEFIVDYYLSYFIKGHPVSIEYCGSNSSWNWLHLYKSKTTDHFVSCNKIYRHIDISSVFGCKNVTIKISHCNKSTISTMVSGIGFSLSVLIIHDTGNISMFIPSFDVYDDFCFKLNLN